MFSTITVKLLSVTLVHHDSGGDNKSYMSLISLLCERLKVELMMSNTIKERNLKVQIIY